MSHRDESGRLREHKLAALRALELPVAPNRYGPSHRATEVVRDFDALEGQRVCVAGRLMRTRVMGKASFAHIQDVSGQLQVYFKLDDLGPAKYEYFKLLDLGDIIGVEGFVFKTRTGEVSVHADDVVLLAKAYAPLPEKFHGLSDVETRYRQRYLDLIANEEARTIVRARSSIVKSIRSFLDARGFIEVETPIMQPLYGGAAANPFVTRYAALDMNVYLRIATELYLKRLIVGGLERVYEIGKDFRNEGFSRKHSPEFTMCELYQAYADYTDVMTLFENMVSSIACDLHGSPMVQFEEQQIDLSPPWTRITIRDALIRYADIDVDAFATVADLEARARESGVEIATAATRGEIIEELVSERVEPQLIQPTFLIDYPIDFPGSLLAKRKATNPQLTERFEAYAAGMELGNAFTELNEPDDQRARMEEAAHANDGAPAAVDLDFLLALEHGMPPTGGIGFGIDRLTMLLTNARQVRETILFPLLRPREVDDAES